MSARRRRLVLVVEDDRYLRESVRELLEDAGCTVLCAENEHDAIEVVRARGRELDVAVLDVRFPTRANADDGDSQLGMRSGLRVGRMIRQQGARTRIVGYSNFAEEEVVRWFREYAFAFLEKSLVVEKPELFRQIVLDASRQRQRKPNCFVVHGHDEDLLTGLVDFLTDTLRWKRPTVLRERPSLGRTVIEKFEDEARRVDLAFVLLTPDDRSLAGSSDIERRRARQNVIFELGYFYGKLQRAGGQVILLYKGELELPSDISGIVYLDASAGVSSIEQPLRNELRRWL